MVNNNISVGIVNNEVVKFELNKSFTTKNEQKTIVGVSKAFIKDNSICIENNGNTFMFNNKVSLAPTCDKNCFFEIKNVKIGIDFHWEQFENQKFKGTLILIKTNNTIQVINYINVEDYLLSVISSEMSANCSLALLKAHSIISRSWVLAQINKQNNLIGNNKCYKSEIKTSNEYICWYDRENHKLFDVCADDHCQRYQGINRINNKNVECAINETKGMVLMQNGKICDARFSKCCGGVSELFENCWENEPHKYLTSITDAEKETEYKFQNEEDYINFIQTKPNAFCNTSDKNIITQVLNNYDTKTQNFFRWEVKYSQNELQNIIKEKSGIDFGNILDLLPIERGVSGRLIKLKIIGDKATLTIGKELEIRRWLSKTHLYSSAFIVAKQNINNNIPNNFKLTGAGWGHGVGLCQIGAAAMGEKGYSYIQILNHYFKNTDISALY